jgi:hypothetical protein
LQIRYCGGCNPFIDRVSLADEVRAALARQAPEASASGASGADRAVSGEASANGGVPSAGDRQAVHRPATLLYVSGCPRACASDHRLSIGEDPAAIVVAGEHVDATPTIAADISPTVIRRLTSPAAPPHPDHSDDVHHDDVAHKG